MPTPLVKFHVRGSDPGAGAGEALWPRTRVGIVVGRTVIFQVTHVNQKGIHSLEPERMSPPGNLHRLALNHFLRQLPKQQGVTPKGLYLFRLRMARVELTEEVVMTRINRMLCAALLLLITGCVVREHVVVRTPPVPPPP